MATIKVPRRVRDHVRDAAKAVGVTQGQLIEDMLLERRKAQFWAKLESESPDQEYLDSLAEADAATLPDADDQITRFESGA
ncbi:MAG: hypothetical protein QM607_11750 [Microbacterium sp.]